MDKIIVLFDGVCNFCNAWVQLIIRYDKKDRFRFASLQSEVGQELLKKSGVDAPESVVVIENGKYYFHSSAALRISRHLDGFWKLMIVFYILPKFIRDRAYNILARNRYKWFGKRDTCMVPDEKIKSRFL
jgi:predicted DCC family thiol-disulfide oxidoreductase YuxK